MKTKYPLATVIPYGPDDRTVTKIAVSILREDSRVLAIERWVGTDVASDPQVATQMYEFMRTHGAKTILTATAVLGCMHEEGQDYPNGEDCPFCPFWKGKQSSTSSDNRWMAMKYLRAQPLGFAYRFWLG